VCVRESGLCAYVCVCVCALVFVCVSRMHKGGNKNTILLTYSFLNDFS
jgi:hypothetical protein